MFSVPSCWQAAEARKKETVYFPPEAIPSPTRSFQRPAHRSDGKDNATPADNDRKLNQEPDAKPRILGASSVKPLGQVGTASERGSSIGNDGVKKNATSAEHAPSSAFVPTRLVGAPRREVVPAQRNIPGTVPDEFRHPAHGRPSTGNGSVGRGGPSHEKSVESERAAAKTAPSGAGSGGARTSDKVGNSATGGSGGGRGRTGMAWRRRTRDVRASRVLPATSEVVEVRSCSGIFLCIPAEVSGGLALVGFLLVVHLR